VDLQHPLGKLTFRVARDRAFRAKAKGLQDSNAIRLMQNSLVEPAKMMGLSKEDISRQLQVEFAIAKAPVWEDALPLPVTTTELRYTLEQLGKNKPLGPSGLTAEMLLYASTEAQNTYLLPAVNDCFKHPEKVYK
jgi:hypothetical protein